MSCIEDKLGTITADALSKINDKTSRRRDEQTENSNYAGGGQGLKEKDQVGRSTSSSQSQQQQGVPHNLAIGWQTNQPSGSPFGGGIPFGGDALSTGSQPRPPIGFRIQNLSSESSGRDPLQAQQESVAKSQLIESSESLYQGDCRKLSWYPRLFFACLLRLLLFIGKIYQDFLATKYYNLLGLTGHFLISAATLFLPTIMFTLYRVARYFQLVLPRPSAIINDQTNLPLELTRLSSSAAPTAAHRERGQSGGKGSSRNATTSPVQGEDEGLVTARQTPTTMEEYHDSKSYQPNEPVGTNCLPAPPERTRRRSQQQLAHQQPLTSAELANVDKMGNLPDKRTTSVVIGASEQLLHGILFIFWNLKRQVDVLSFLVARACKWRAPTQWELEQLDRLQTDSNGLEWFQDFYAAFLAILTQVYSIGLLWSINLGPNGLQGAPALAAVSDKLSNPTLVETLGQFARSWEPKDLLVLSQLIVSLAVLASLLMAVRRLDDGPLTLGLSILGWGALFPARIIIIAFSFLHLGWPLMLPLVIAHVYLVAFWIYKIALDSHDDQPSERQHEAMWDQAVEEEVAQAEQNEQEPTTPKANNESERKYSTKNWTVMDHVTLLTQIFCLFAIPSLFYWPIMFNLKLHARPFKYLLLILVQNFLLIPAIWYQLVSPSAGQLYTLGAVGVLSILGFIFIALYIACKPNLTEYFAQADEQFNQAKKAGVYYEYCSRVFKMPDLTKHSFRRLMKQEEYVEVVLDEN